MKHLPLVVIVGALAAAVYMYAGFSGGFDLFGLWVAAPFLLLLVIAVLQSLGDVKLLVASICAAIASVLILYPYYEEYTFEGIDGQVGFAFAFGPIIQMFLFIMLSLLGYFGVWLVRVLKKLHSKAS